ncbi:MAG: hypothetical protein C0467_07185 [Planctomycetaceae bacterium]|nr:hypothetical protein [Planctomycetaceae bacterium]
MITQTNRIRRTISRLFVVAVVLMMTGCGQQSTDVTGMVTSRGRPVVWGTVSIIGSDQMTYYAPIQLDGTFTVTGVPVGQAKVGVYSPDPYFELPVSRAVKLRIEEARRASGVVTPPKPPKGQWIKLPTKYSDPLSSGIVAELTAPTMPLDIRLD